MTFNPLIISFDESQEDIPVLLVGHKNIFNNYGTGSIFMIDNMITGTKAVEIWNYLTGKSPCKDCNYCYNVREKTEDQKSFNINTVIECEHADICSFAIHQYQKATRPEPLNNKRCICDNCIHYIDKDSSACTWCGDGGVSNFEPISKEDKND